MDFDEILQKIESSDAFKKFKEKNKDAELCAGFFVIDYEKEQTQQQLDYCLKNGDIYTFIFGDEISLKKAETVEGKAGKLENIRKEIKVDLDDVEKIVKENTKKKILKIIAVLQEHEGKEIWNLTCILEGMSMLRMHIDTQAGDVLKKEEHSMFDFIKKVK